MRVEGHAALVTGGASGLGAATMINGETIRIDGALRMAPR
jgi:short-subunit dehydrogenase involved in D-alanine esterification of teichoic acids